MNRLAAVTALFLVAHLAFAGEDPQPTPPPNTGGETKVIVRERNVYVPYDKLKETFEKEGRGVFLPYEEFLKLWNAGQIKVEKKEDPKPPSEAVISGGSYVGVAKEGAARFEVTYKIRALGKNWSKIALPLKNVAVETVTVSDPLALFAPAGDGYQLLLPKPGEYTLTLAFSVRIDSKPGQRKIEFGIPPTAVSRLELSIPEKDLRVEVLPKLAATVATAEGENTKVLAFVGNASTVEVTWMPPLSKVEKGESLVIASQNMHVELGERMLRLDTTLAFRIERNEEDTFRVKLPTDMRLLSVRGGNIREWNTEAGVLVVRLHSPAKENYALALRFERILEKTPEKLDVPFPSVVGALREDGFITLAHDSALRLRIDTATGLSQTDPRELPEPLRRANLLAGFRYLAHPLALSLSIETLQPQIQSNSAAVAILGLDDDTLTGFVEYQIAKVGVFTLKLKFESRWDVASIGDPQTVEDYQLAVDGAYKTLSVNLKNKALGAFRLPFRLTGPSRAAPGQVGVETIQVLGTQQDKGLLAISAPKAFKATTVDRNKMTGASLNQFYTTGLQSQVPQDYDLPLAYTFTQQPASVKLELERRQTEIRVNGLHTINVSEASLDVMHKLDYFIEFAGVDKLSLSIPEALDEKIFEIKCPGLKERKVRGVVNGRRIIDLFLQEKVLGAVPVVITHKDNLKGLEPEKPQDIAIPDIRAEEVKAQQGFIAVRKESAHEITATSTQLETIDNVNLPAEQRSSNTYLAFRYLQPERTLTLQLTRHIPVQTAGALISLLRSTFVLSEEKKLAVRAELWIENARGEQYLELNLPAGAEIRALVVNGQAVPPLQKKGGGTLVKLASASGIFPVQLIYSVSLGSDGLGVFGGLEFATLQPAGNVPVNKIEADVYLPDGYAYMSFAGTLHPRDRRDGVSNTLSWLDSVVRGHRDPVLLERGGANLQAPQSPLLGAFETQGRLFRFQTLSPVGTLKLSYCNQKVFHLFSAVVLLVALFGGWFLIRRRGFSALAVCTVLLLTPLCLSWLVTSDGGQPLSAWLAGAVLLSVALLLRRVREAYDNWREARIAMAPDPFLEDAVAATSVPPTPPEPPAPSGETSADAKPAEPAASAEPPVSSDTKPEGDVSTQSKKKKHRDGGK